MCSETFLRLPEEKRTRFLNAAWEEFTRVPFSQASINKIVLRARIPRGSFYQYFSDKEDLFSYLLDGMLEHFYEEYGRFVARNGGDIFQTQLNCYDQVLSGAALDALFARGTTLLRLNPMFLIDHFMKRELVYQVWEVVRDRIDHRMFRDAETERQVFVMSLGLLVISLRGAAARPDRAESSRQELVRRLELLKHGCLSEDTTEVHT